MGAPFLYVRAEMAARGVWWFDLLTCVGVWRMPNVGRSVACAVVLVALELVLVALELVLVAMRNVMAVHKLN